MTMMMNLASGIFLPFHIHKIILNAYFCKNDQEYDHDDYGGGQLS